jgi:hypothetical protein
MHGVVFEELYGTDHRVAALLELGDKAAKMKAYKRVDPEPTSLSDVAIDIRNLDVDTPTGIR